MKKLALFALAILATITLTGCIDSGYYGGQASVYGGGPAYGYDDYRGGYGYGGYGYGGGYYSEPVYIRRDYFYANGRRCYAPVYRHHNDVYYVHEGKRHSVSSSDRAKYNAALYDYKNKQLHAENRAKIQTAQNQQKINEYRNEQALKQNQYRYKTEQQKKQWELDQKVAQNRANAQYAVNRSKLEQQKKEWQYQQKVNEARNRAEIAKYRAAHPSSNDDDDKKKKKKD